MVFYLYIRVSGLWYFDDIKKALQEQRWVHCQGAFVAPLRLAREALMRSAKLHRSGAGSPARRRGRSWTSTSKPGGRRSPTCCWLRRSTGRSSSAATSGASAPASTGATASDNPARQGTESHPSRRAVARGHQRSSLRPRAALRTGRHVQRVLKAALTTARADRALRCHGHALGARQAPVVRALFGPLDLEPGFKPYPMLEPRWAG